MNREPPDDGVQEEGLLAELRRIAASADASPPEAVAAAKAAYLWRTVDAELEELASLRFDSVLAEDRLVGVRGGGGPRQLTFEAGDLTVEVELDLDAVPQLHGQLIPPRAVEVEVRAPSGVRRVPADALGRFSLSDLTAGPLSLRVPAPAGSGSVATEWVLL